MPSFFVADKQELKNKPILPIIPINASQLEHFLDQQSDLDKNWSKTSGFIAKPGQVCLLPNAQGQLSQIWLGVADQADFWSYGALTRTIPEGYYQINPATHAVMSLTPEQLERAHLAFALGAYQFNAYVMREDITGRFLVVDSELKTRLDILVDSIYFARDLINTPAADMGPAQLAAAARQLAKEAGADCQVIVGEDLLRQNYPTIYAVGKGSAQAPCLIDISWGDANAPKLTLVGKGVCFDSGGLDIKPSAGMRDMKKDMGGAAHVLALARLIMLHELPVRLRVLIPAVENAVDGKSYHPGDIIKTRSGLTVEIENTDAEGRLILCDALSEAVNDQPRWLINFATLTGAARVALGPDLPALFTAHDSLARELLAAAERADDPIWRLPLHKPYREYFKTELADLLNASKIPYAGAITAALYLQSFVPDDIAWAHFDICGSNLENRPGRPQGGEVTGVRAVWDFIQQAIKTK